MPDIPANGEINVLLIPRRPIFPKQAEFLEFIKKLHKFCEKE